MTNSTLTARLKRAGLNKGAFIFARFRYEKLEVSGKESERKRDHLHME